MRFEQVREIILTKASSVFSLKRLHLIINKRWMEKERLGLFTSTLFLEFFHVNFSDSHT